MINLKFRAPGKIVYSYFPLLSCRFDNHSRHISSPTSSIPSLFRRLYSSLCDFVTAGSIFPRLRFIIAIFPGIFGSGWFSVVGVSWEWDLDISRGLEKEGDQEKIIYISMCIGEFYCNHFYVYSSLFLSKRDRELNTHSSTCVWRNLVGVHVLNPTTVWGGYVAHRPLNRAIYIFQVVWHWCDTSDEVDKWPNLKKHQPLALLVVE